MDIIFLIISIGLLGELCYFMINKKTLQIIPFFKKQYLGSVNLIGVVVMIIMLYDSESIQFIDNHLQFPTLSIELKIWPFILIIFFGLIEGIGLIMWGFLESLRNRSGKGIFATKNLERTEKLFNLNNNQTKAMKYMQRYRSMTLVDFHRICPNNTTATLEEDIMGLEKLGLIDTEIDRYVLK